MLEYTGEYGRKDELRGFFLEITLSEVLDLGELQAVNLNFFHSKHF